MTTRLDPPGPGLAVAPADRPRPLPASNPASPEATWLAFGLFLVANAVLFVRPTEFVEDVLGAQLFQVMMAACLLVGFPAVFALFGPGALRSKPLLLLPLLLLPLVFLSDFGKGRFDEAFESLGEMLKVLAYYLLLLGLVTTPGRIKQFLFWMPWFTFIIVLVAVLQYHEVIKLELFKQLQDNDVKRLQATGIFKDPNDLGALVTFAMLCCLYLLFRGHWAFAPVWLGLLGLFFYAVYLTHSRGSLLALGTGLFFLLRARIGTFPSLALAAMLLPGMLLLSGREIAVGERHDTTTTRVGLWSDALVEFTRSPAIGVGFDDLRKGENMGMVAHNSYLHAFAELGFVGGCVFLGLFVWALWRLLALTLGGRRIVDPRLADLHPTMLALLAAYMVSIFSLSLCYVFPTFTVLGLAAAYLHMTATDPPLPRPVLNDRFFLWLALCGVVFLVGVKALIPAFRLLMP